MGLKVHEVALNRLISRLGGCGSLCEIETNVNLMIQWKEKFEAP